MEWKTWRHFKFQNCGFGDDITVPMAKLYTLLATIRLSKKIARYWLLHISTVSKLGEFKIANEATVANTDSDQQVLKTYRNHIWTQFAKIPNKC